ncbi:acyltransferase family protein, partial [Pantoea ananatis]|uniref:acyltransferase family protein n=2 Tax=Pantoea TaxID=53335 RepID=UPI000DB3EDE0
TFYNIGASLSFAVVILISDSSFNIYFMPAVASTFFFIALGGNLFGLLNIKGFIRLGDASYSIYMLHGVAWFCMNRFIQSHNFHLDQTQYMVLSGTVFLFFLIACSLSYKFVELPFINLGKKS